mgnify:CR=1 FL=1
MLARRSVLRKTVPEVYVRTSASGVVFTQGLGHSFSQYGPPGRKITYLFSSGENNILRVSADVDKLRQTKILKHPVIFSIYYMDNGVFYGPMRPTAR